MVLGQYRFFRTNWFWEERNCTTFINELRPGQTGLNWDTFVNELRPAQTDLSWETFINELRSRQTGFGRIELGHLVK